MHKKLDKKLDSQARGLIAALMFVGALSGGCGSKSKVASGGSGSAAGSAAAGSAAVEPTLTANAVSSGLLTFANASGKASFLPKVGPSAHALSAAAIPADPVTTDPDVNELLQCGSHPGTCFDNNNPFFKVLGTNGRSCASCHWASAGMTVTPSQLQAIGAADGYGITPDSMTLGAIFRPIDGANNPLDPNASSTNPALRQTAYSLLLSKALIRISNQLLPGLPFNLNPQFTITSVVDPYGYVNLGANDLPFPYYQHLALDRRPVPLIFEPGIFTIMWDGRESPTQVGCPCALANTPGCDQNPVLPPSTPGACSLPMDLGNQATHATTGHSQANQPLTSEQEQAILNFQFQLNVAQTYDNQAGDLTANGARGGPNAMMSMPQFVGNNDNFGTCIDAPCKVLGAPLGIGQRNPPFNTNVFTIYNAFALAAASTPQASISRGQTLFNTFDFNISGVNGINDQAAFCGLIGQPAPCGPIPGNCTTCHDNFNVGNHTVARQLTIGTASFPEFMTNDLPLYTITCNAVGLAAHACGQTPLTLSIIGGPPGDCTGQLLTKNCLSAKGTDPGKALISGLFSEFTMVKGPILRALASRAPYFHQGLGGAAGDESNPSKGLLVVVQFYEDRFNFTFDATVTTPRLQGCGLPNSPPPQNATTCPTPSPASPSEQDLVNFLLTL